MLFTEGEKVHFLDETGTGIIIKKIGLNLYIVEDLYGFEIEKKSEELVKIYSEDYSKSKIYQKDSAITNIPKLKHNKNHEIDLHLHHLIDNDFDLSSHEKLLLQLSSLDKYINESILAKRIPDFVIIHGVGEGILKSEIHTYLYNKKGFIFYEADYRKYGKGATKVEVKYTRIDYL